jgi:hypothetical protein
LGSSSSSAKNLQANEESKSDRGFEMVEDLDSTAVPQYMSWVLDCGLHGGTSKGSIVRTKVVKQCSLLNA